MTEFNDIGISHKLDWPRIAHLFRIGLFGAVLGVLCRAGDHADSGFRERSDTVSEMVLGVLIACRYGGSYTDDRVR